MLSRFHKLSLPFRGQQVARDTGTAAVCYWQQEAGWIKTAQGSPGAAAAAVDPWFSLYPGFELL